MTVLSVLNLTQMLGLSKVIRILWTSLTEKLRQI